MNEITVDMLIEQLQKLSQLGYGNSQCCCAIDSECNNIRRLYSFGIDKNTIAGVLDDDDCTYYNLPKNSVIIG